MNCFKYLIYIILLLILSFFPKVHAQAKETKSINSSVIHGYISNKIYNPIKLKISEIDKDSLFLIERNLDDDSYVPLLNLMVTAEILSDYLINEENIFIPELTKFTGYISEIKTAKSFNRKGLFKVTFNSVTCPDSETINLKSNLISESSGPTYNPLHHIGKTTLNLLGGSLAGTLLAYELGGLGLTAATHGYSLACGAATGGFIGTIGGIASKGKNASVEPGQELIIAPIDEISLGQLKQVQCKKIEKEENATVSENKNYDVEILSAKEKKDAFGDSAFKIEIKFTNNSKERYRSSNFFLRDSQGNEYSTSFININEEMFIDFPPNETKKANLEFFVDYPKAKHWLVLKDRNFSNEIGKWKIEI